MGRDDDYSKDDTSKGLSSQQSNMYASRLLVVAQIAIVILFGVCTKEEFVEDNFSDIYVMFTGIEIMMFFGFGYLMTFLSRYGLGAIGLTMLITIIGIQWGILVEGFFKAVYHNSWVYVRVDIYSFMDSLFLVAAILISYGSVIGRLSPLQLIVMTLLETICYSINKVLLLFGAVDLVDAGGTISIHMFGAYFGLAVAYVIGKPSNSISTEGSSIADIFSLVGTLFLWIYWPSFNAGALEPNSHQHQRAIASTILALCASTMGTFIVSMNFTSGFKIRPVDVQNATLAGGVGVGAICHLTMNFADSLLTGLAAGSVSSLGYAVVQSNLEKWGIHDSCGVHNLHGLPSIIGGIASVILMGYKGPQGHDYPTVIEHKQYQWGHQLVSIFITLILSIFSGLVCGLILRELKCDSTVECFTDKPYWQLAEEENSEKDSAVDQAKICPAKVDDRVMKFEEDETKD